MPRDLRKRRGGEIAAAECGGPLAVEACAERDGSGLQRLLASPEPKRRRNATDDLDSFRAVAEQHEARDGRPQLELPRYVLVRVHS